MAEPLNEKERLEWSKQHYRLREGAIAGMFAHLDKHERQKLRERLLDPEFEMPAAYERRHAEEFRRRWLDALAELDVLEALELLPNKAARREASSLLRKVSQPPTRSAR